MKVHKEDGKVQQDINNNLQVIENKIIGTADQQDSDEVTVPILAPRKNI